MGKSKDLASGNSAAYVETAGDTMTGTLNVNGGNFNLAPDNAAAHRYMFLNTGASQDGHILLQRALANKYQITAKTDNSYSIYGYPASGEVFNINSSGHVTMPNQPSFKAHGGVAGYITTSPIPFSSVSGYGGHNVGGHFNTSNYRFTCPIAGRYFFHLHMGIVKITTGTGAAYPSLRVNGTNNEYSYVNFQSAPSYATAHISVFKNLAVNDYVDVVFAGGSYGTYYGGFAELAFSGFLIG